MTEATSRSYKQTVQDYCDLFDESAGGNIQARRRGYSSMVNDYYDLVTDFYEFGWGPSFHFAPRRKHETFRDSLIRYELFLAGKLGLANGERVLDIGCGVGGPLINIGRHCGARITGINNNGYQLDKGRRYLVRAKLDRQCELILADFMHIPLPDATYAAAYSIEATPHAPDKVGVFGEVLRLLEPGGLFAGYEWCVTDAYDARISAHRRIKADIELGTGLPELVTAEAIVGALDKAGFQVIERWDRALEADPETPWYRALTGRDFSLSSIPRLPLGRTLTNGALRVLETLGIAPRGSPTVSSFLNRCADALVRGGRSGIFTPMFYFLARKPDE